MSKKALLVVDMLNDFVDERGALPVPKAKNIILPIKNLIDYFRSHKRPVIYVCDNHLEDDPEFEVWGRHAVRGSSGANVIDELKPLPSDPIIYKRRFSGFFGTELDLLLREKEIKKLIITGVLTNICVLYTASDAYQLGYKVIVPKDCVAAVDEDMHKFALRQLEEVVGAKIVESHTELL